MKNSRLYFLVLITALSALAWLFFQFASHSPKQAAQTQSSPSIATQSIEEALFLGDLAAQKSLTTIVLRDIQQGIKPEQFKTGNPLKNAT
jgi:hypothetical protein